MPNQVFHTCSLWVTTAATNANATCVVCACAGSGPLALVVVPTRELAKQVHTEIVAWAQAWMECVVRPASASAAAAGGAGGGAAVASQAKVRAALVVGGASFAAQQRLIRGGVEVVVATGGRLVDMLQKKVLALDR